ncbi:MAG: hypothetical protein JWL77_2048 [Chthonomonadaceae bacterium]|nr:hypothetical protein [Chthonomonadaceae bacterium]
MKVGLSTRVILMIFRLCQRTEFDGIEIGIFPRKKPDADLIHKKVVDALVLIRHVDPRRYRYLQRDVKRIMVFGTPSYQGKWHNLCALCELTDTYVQNSETTPELVASTIVHEAMHARLYRMGIG